MSAKYPVNIPYVVCRHCRNRLYRLTAEQVATLCDVTYFTVNHWLNHGDLQGRKSGRRWAIKPRELRRFLERRPDIWSRWSARQERMAAEGVTEVMVADDHEDHDD